MDSQLIVDTRDGAYREDDVAILMSRGMAQWLLDITTFIAGDPATTRRRYATHLQRHLNARGMRMTPHDLLDVDKRVRNQIRHT